MATNDPQDFGVPWILEDFMPIKQPVTADSPPICVVCKKTNSTKRCGDCKTTHYCSHACQVADWPLHKLICRSYTRFLDLGTQTPTSRRALYFPIDQQRPQFVTVDFEKNGYPLDIQKFFPDCPAADIKKIAFHNRFQSYWVQIAYDGNTKGKRKLEPNQCVARAIGAETPTAKFRGSFVVLAYDAVVGLEKPALDLDTGVWGALVEYLKLRGEYKGPVFVEQPQERFKEELWRSFMGHAVGI